MQALYDIYYKLTIFIAFAKDLYHLKLKDDDDIHYFPIRRVHVETGEVDSWCIIVTTDSRYAWQIEKEINSANDKLKDRELRDSA